MHLTCARCGYDSGDFDTNEEIAAQVNADGGYMEMDYDSEDGKPTGWDIVCPKCDDDGDSEEFMHLD